MLLRRRSEKAEALKQVPMFAGLSRRQLEQVAQHVEEIEREADKVIVKQGHTGKDCMLILNGEARVDRDGVELARLTAGAVVGEMSLIDGKPRTATVTTTMPSTLLVIEGRAFDSLLETVPGLQRKLLLTLCERLRAMDERLNA
jgi:CRP/FNR family transcriptional regulator, cyclic AMP receptor protein